MEARAKRRLILATAAAAAVLLGAVIVQVIRARAPYRVDEELLTGWTLAAAPPGDLAVVEAKPPARLLEDLFRQVSGRSDHALVAPDRAAVPLVLAGEYSDSLQGALSVEDILSVGHDVGLDEVRFEPVCIGERHRDSGDSAEELYFAVFQTPQFDRFRLELTPVFPEHAGSGVYDPPALRLILTVAATSKDFDHWSPLGINPQQDCSVSLRPS